MRGMRAGERSRIMRETLETYQTKILALGAAHTAALPVDAICFHLDFRDICASNACGMFGRCWMCPPAVGAAEDLIAHAKSFHQALVYQTIHPIEDSFDIEGMLAAGERQNRLAQAVQSLLRQNGEERFLHLGAGGCRYCPTCAKADEQPCRFPNRALASLEAYCIDVSRLAKSCGLKYINGANTVTYFGLLLL